MDEKNSKTVKKTMSSLAVLHPFEAAAAFFIAKKKGKNPILWSILTLIFGVFALVPLLKSKKTAK